MNHSGSHFSFIPAGVKCRVKAVLYRSADYIFISFEIIEPILVTLKIEYRLKAGASGVCSLANYTAVYEET